MMNNAELDLRHRDHQRVARFIESSVGIQLPPHKRSLIEARLRRRLKDTGFRKIDEYLDFALSDAGAATEQALLIDAITTNKTDFFREPAHFDYLARHIRESLLPLKQLHARRPLKVWSAACSTGEEPYTLAMVLMEIARQHGEFDFTIDATDINSSVLNTAAEATYPADRIGPIPEPLRQRYLLKSRDPSRKLVRFIPDIRRKINFSSFNLIGGNYPPKPQFDVIFCRNVMIYFNEEDRQRIISRFRQTLCKGGLLFIGHSESIGAKRRDFQTLMPTVYQRVE